MSNVTKTYVKRHRFVCHPSPDLPSVRLKRGILYVIRHVLGQKRMSNVTEAPIFEVIKAGYPQFSGEIG